MDKLQSFASEQLKTNVPQFNVGDTVVVHNRIKEGAKERIQLFEGLVIAKKNGGISETFTVRHVAYGVGVEKTFPLPCHSDKSGNCEFLERNASDEHCGYHDGSYENRTGSAAGEDEQTYDYGWQIDIQYPFPERLLQESK